MCKFVVNDCKTMFARLKAFAMKKGHEFDGWSYGKVKGKNCLHLLQGTASVTRSIGEVTDIHSFVKHLPEISFSPLTVRISCIHTQSSNSGSADISLK